MNTQEAVYQSNSAAGNKITVCPFNEQGIWYRELGAYQIAGALAQQAPCWACRKDFQKHGLLRAPGHIGQPGIQEDARGTVAVSSMDVLPAHLPRFQIHILCTNASYCDPKLYLEL